MNLKHTEYSNILLLDNESHIPKDLADHIWEHLERKIQDLQPGIKKTLKQICENDFWCQLSRVETRMAGKYVAYLVARKQLPLSFVGKTTSNSQIYIRN